MTAIPEIGQLVHACGRAFVVAEIQPQGLPGDATQPAQPPMHLLKLSSVEDDAFGEEMDLFWELEPGTSVRERTAALPEPTGFDPPLVLAAFLNAVRWGPSPRPTTRRCSRRFAAGSRSTITSWPRWCGP